MEPWDGATPDLTDPGTVALYDEVSLWSAPFGQVLLDAVELRPGLTVLDVGCGSGYPLLELAERLGPGARLHGVDPWAPAMERLRTKVAAWGLERAVTLHVTAVESLGLPAASIDLVVSNNGLNNVADLPRALEVCAGLARPGAQLVFTANLPGTMAAFYDALGRALDEAGVEDGQRRIARHIRARRRPAEELVELTRAAGFDVQDASIHAFRWSFASAEALFRHHFIRLAFLEPWRAIVPEQSRPEVFRSVLGLLDRDALRLEVPFTCISAHRR
ncbi:MAG TPA: class I SAM-dependent methyltransferase [Myxococcaceae bacterium]|nr:class I SAM-dependent methyltransferase [Myxococcaceae bacterium]